jgi:hypothetical protein
MEGISRRDSGTFRPILHPHPERLNTERLSILSYDHVLAATLDCFKSGD